MSGRLVNLADKHANSETLLAGQLVDSITNHHNIRIFAKKTMKFPG
jgi:ATP-binding cassette subfamily B protein